MPTSVTILWTITNSLPSIVNCYHPKKELCWLILFKQQRIGKIISMRDVWHLFLNGLWCLAIPISKQISRAERITRNKMRFSSLDFVSIVCKTSGERDVKRVREWTFLWIRNVCSIYITDGIATVIIILFILNAVLCAIQTLSPFLYKLIQNTKPRIFRFSFSMWINEPWGVT